MVGVPRPDKHSLPGPLKSKAWYPVLEASLKGPNPALPLCRVPSLNSPLLFECIHCLPL